jgi:uncharacterized protein (TIGR00725 family)
VSEGPYISVIGAGQASDDEMAAAEEIGRRLADAGAVLVCGGLGGVMDAAARGSAAAGGTSVGILPGEDRTHGSTQLTVRISTGLGEARNAIVARAADAVIAVGGEFGTLSEIALAPPRRSAPARREPRGRGRSSARGGRASRRQRLVTGTPSGLL